MTKEELKQEAEEYADKLARKLNVPSDSELLLYARNAYLAGAEPREKQIQIDAEQIRALQKQNGELNDKVKELEAQIEKMKCCGNCKFGYKCSLFSIQVYKENGVEYQTQAKWNKEKEKYCNVGYNGKYECWEIKEK